MERFLPVRHDLRSSGFTADRLPCGDWIVSVRHDGARSVVVAGDGDPQQIVDDDSLTYEGLWRVSRPAALDSSGKTHVAESAGAAVLCRFDGNQVRVIGRVDPAGGLAEVVLDGVKQAVGIDCWTPGRSRHQQVLYYRNGLKNGRHKLKNVAKARRC